MVAVQGVEVEFVPVTRGGRGGGGGGGGYGSGRSDLTMTMMDAHCKRCNPKSRLCKSKWLKTEVKQFKDDKAREGKMEHGGGWRKGLGGRADDNGKDEWRGRGGWKDWRENDEWKWVNGGWGDKGNREWSEGRRNDRRNEMVARTFGINIYWKTIKGMIEGDGKGGGGL